MKRNVLLLTTILFFCSSARAIDTLKVNSKVEKVVVFLKGAQVKRTARYNLQRGDNIVNFTKISSHIDEKSIQVKSDSSVAIQSVNFNINFMDSLVRLQKIISLHKDNDSLAEEKLLLENRLYVLIQEQELLKENQVLSGEKRIIKTEELKEASTYFRKRLSEIVVLKINTKKKLRRIEIEEWKIKKQLNELNSKKEKPVGEIRVLVHATEPGEKEFSIEYFIADAGWRPKYDIRAKSVSTPAILSYKADVFQNTDDDWTNVELILSSSNPSLGGTVPVLKSWFLDLNSKYEYLSDVQDNSNYQNSIAYYDNLVDDYSDTSFVDGEMIITGTVVDDNGEPVPGASIRAKGHSDVGTISDLNGSYSLNIPRGAGKLIFSFVGMQTVEIPVTSLVVNCTMDYKDIGIDEVVVMALGVSREKRALGYAVTTLVPDGFGGFVPEGIPGSSAGVSIVKPKREKKKKKLVSKTIVGLNAVKENQTSVQFALNKPYTIPSDNKNYTVDIEKYEIPVHYQYSSVPKLEDSAFLLAQLMGWESLNLLSGAVNIYFEGSFIGNSNLDVENISDTLDISLGRDRAIMIERKMKKDFSRQQMLSKWKVESYSWEIIVKNNKSEKVNVIVEDQIPVSYSKGIEIELLESSNATYDKNKGELNWNLELEPLEKKILTFSYLVKTKN